MLGPYNLNLPSNLYSASVSYKPGAVCKQKYSFKNLMRDIPDITANVKDPPKNIFDPDSTFCEADDELKSRHCAVSNDESETLSNVALSAP